MDLEFVYQEGQSLKVDDAQEIPDEFYGGAHFLLRVAETNKALLKDEEAANVDVHLYRSMIGSLMYLTASRSDIMFAICACARDSPFDLEAFSDSDYASSSLDRKSTTGDETVIKGWEDRMEMAATTASSLEAEQDSGAKIPYWVGAEALLGLRLHLNSLMIHLSQELTHLEVGMIE
ncbi:hypothetical protein Tco_1039991 [Tanacetum coccineum]